MRADRLVGILLMLQAKGQVTAGQVAEEFEVSERTARRDLDALGAAGLPVYAVPGRGGGWRLLREGRTDLSGLSEAEVRALFLLAGPDAEATGAVRSALRKLASALPEPLQATAEFAAEAVIVDPAPWDRSRANRRDPALLDAVQRAVVERREIEIDYVSRDLVPSRRTVQPLGLVAKDQTWYLIAGTDRGQRTLRIDRVTSLEETGAVAVRPEEFELAEAWAMVEARIQSLRLPVTARCVATRRVLRQLRFVFGDRLVVGDAIEVEGFESADDPGAGELRVHVEVRAVHLDQMAAEIAGFGSDLVALHPPELRRRLSDTGRHLVSIYGTVHA